ncbi:hypothetical protein [Bernardetia sp.]|uniref:hypothetical protein n=1 Tax=Bernardetia sp. TaxID=1937974 RepID=UPI0025C65243|nr:hypothetical protein [Bernardetia sp.]
MSKLNKLPVFKETVYLILDGEASHREEAEFMKFIATSRWHREYFENEKQLHTLIQKSIERQPMPFNLQELIQSQVQEEYNKNTEEEKVRNNK